MKRLSIMAAILLGIGVLAIGSKVVDVAVNSIDDDYDPVFRSYAKTFFIYASTWTIYLNGNLEGTWTVSPDRDLSRDIMQDLTEAAKNADEGRLPSRAAQLRELHQDYADTVHAAILRGGNREALTALHHWKSSALYRSLQTWANS